MTVVSVRWRPSGGRGEFEFVPADSLDGRDIELFVEALDLTLPAEVRGQRAQGKPRLRKFAGNDRDKLHLPQLVMAMARLPEPAREDHHADVIFPLENKSFLIEAMDFDVIDDDGLKAVIEPLRVTILHSNVTINLQDRFDAIRHDIEHLDQIRNNYPDVAKAIESHSAILMAGINSLELRQTADAYIAAQTKHFGQTNAGSASELIFYESQPETDLEEVIEGKEGRLLTRIHAYKERDRKFAKKVREFYKKKNHGLLHCMACGLKPETIYGEAGERCIEAHHKIPIEELQPDSVTQVEDMAMVCASCHRIIHSRKPCLTLDEVRALTQAN